MLNHLTKMLFVFLGSLMLVACHNAPILDKKSATKLLTRSPSLSGYTINMVINNPNARGENSSGWSCDDKQGLIDAGVVQCKEAGRSSDYLTFTNKGKRLLIGKPWGSATQRNAKIIAVSQTIQEIQSLEIIDDSHAIIHYTWVYNKHTPFSNAYLKEIIALDVPHAEKKTLTLVDDRWVLDE